MSTEKREQLIASGQLNPDGSRKDAPPPTDGVVAEPETVEVGITNEGEAQ